MSRIVGGTAGGRRLVLPAGRDTRPTSERAREGLLSTLDTLGGVAGRRILDLYAGSGAVALEALSRGAAFALLVESARPAVESIRHNLPVLGFSAAAEVSQQRVETQVKQECPMPPFDVVFADPPYALTSAELGVVLADAAAGGWLAAGAVAVVERSSRSPDWHWPPGFGALRVRHYGEASLWYGRRS